MRDKNFDNKSKYGDEAPRLKDFLRVLLVLLGLIALSWLAYRLHWFQLNNKYDNYLNAGRADMLLAIFQIH